MHQALSLTFASLNKFGLQSLHFIVDLNSIPESEGCYQLSSSESWHWRQVWKEARKSWGLVQACNDRAEQGTQEGRKRTWSD